ncbi:MAG: phosphatase PAP2 family protein [Verrucomicrobium sp.]|nr:phosphatase PAP2 family protein [Verrucomicrobium sp.]
MKTWFREGVDLAAAAWRRRPSGRFWLFLALAVAAAACAAHPFEPVLEARCPGASGRAGVWARGFSFWGDFLPGTMALVLLCFLAGAAGPRWRQWRRIGWALFLAAAVAGVPATLLRVSLGRPRPCATAEGVRDGLCGFRSSDRYHSFPSGHAATSFATAGALGAAVPPLMPIALAGAAGVCWSRAYLQRHHLSDLIVGGAWGLAVGFHFGRTARGFREERRQARISAVSSSSRSVL